MPTDIEEILVAADASLKNLKSAFSNTFIDKYGMSIDEVWKNISIGILDDVSHVECFSFAHVLKKIRNRLKTNTVADNLEAHERVLQRKFDVKIRLGDLDAIMQNNTQVTRVHYVNIMNQALTGPKRIKWFKERVIEMPKMIDAKTNAYSHTNGIAKPMPTAALSN